MRIATFASLFSLSIVIGAGCGSSSGADGNPGTGAASGSGGSGGSAAGSSGGSSSGGTAGSSGGSGGSAASSSGSGGSGAGANLPTDVTFDYDPSKDVEPETCAATKIDSEEVFLDMFVILDKSGSMTQPFGNNDEDGYCDIGDTNVGSRWCNAINALYGFFEDPTSVGTGVSYAEFADTGCSAFDMDVDFDILQAGDANGHLSAIEAALNDDDPDGSTATEGAVDTLIAETTAHVPSGTRKTIAVLITDGNPTECDGGQTTEEHLTELNGLLVDHYVDNGIPTFIIGMDGVQEDNLELLAVNAGAELHTTHCTGDHTECSYYSVGDGNPQVFIDALDSIRSSVLGCEYSVPSSDVGLSDLDTLEVEFTPDSMSSAVTLSRVDDEGDCASADEYWVDFDAGPDPIVKLCPATCDLRGEGASIDISLKCEGS